MNKFKLLITILTTILLLTGCGSQVNTQAQEKKETIVQENTQAEENQETIVQENTQAEEKKETEHRNKIVSDDNYAKAYAEALMRGLIIPSEESDNLLKKYEAQIEYEPRIVMNTKEELHIIWTNSNEYLVIDGQDTEIKVSECIYSEAYPELPKLENLEEFHKGIKDAKYGIAETAFLNSLVITLKEKGLYKNGLYWARFYNCEGRAVVVYSLEDGGNLYIY